jgi:hypothetical protein
VGVEAGFDAGPIGVAEASEVAKEDAVVECEEFEANKARQRKTRFVVIL